MYLTYSPNREINAAAELRELEMAFPARGTDLRRRTPVFRDDTGSPLTGSNMDKLMVAALTKIGCSHRYSWHGYRAALPCSLLKAKRSNAEIMSLCRWQTEDSLLVYAQLTQEHYRDMLSAAYGQDITTIQPENTPLISEQALAQELFTYDIPRTYDDT
jgi:hypothetical protein